VRARYRFDEVPLKVLASAHQWHMRDRKCDSEHVNDAVADAKARGAWIVVAEQTTTSVRPEQLVPVLTFPAALVLDGERSGVSPQATRIRYDSHPRNGEFAQCRICGRDIALPAHSTL
jgi:hypothetical protein